MITRENILDKTHGGLKIYAHILRQHYPSDTLAVKGNHCSLVRNPFNNGKKSLEITLQNGLARHQDVECSEFEGDAFLFADKHFQKGIGAELYATINDALGLGLRPSAKNALEWLEGDNDEWRPLVSFFKPPIRNILPSEQLSLSQVHTRIAGRRYANITQQLRSISDPKERRNFKAFRFPYVCFSGVFSKRSEQHLVKHSGLLVFDFDHLEEVEESAELLLHEPLLDAELLFRSPSGQGLKFVVRFNPEEYRQYDYFLAVTNYLWETHRLKSDLSGSDVSRACFLAEDNKAFLHPRHVPVIEGNLSG